MNLRFNSCEAALILVASLAVSWLRPFLKEDLCGLLAAAILPGRFLPAVGYALSHRLYVQEDFVRPIDQTVLLSVDRVVVHHFEKDTNKEGMC